MTRALCDGDTFEHRGYTFTVMFPIDSDNGEPWNESDGHGIVSEWTTRAKGPGERVLAADRDRFLYYDVAATMKIARRDKWGTRDGRQPGETARQYAARAVEADFEYLRSWCADEWQYCGVVVTLDDETRGRLVLPERESVWGIENNADAYLTATAYELADQLAERLDRQREDEELDARVKLAADFGFGA